MSQTSIVTLDHLTSFWQSADERMAQSKTKGNLPAEDPVTITTTYAKGDQVISEAVVTMPPDVSFYRYLKGTATLDNGTVHEYTHRFETSPESDEAAQKMESEECRAVVQAELDRWVLAQQPALTSDPIPPATQ